MTTEPTPHELAALAAEVATLRREVYALTNQLRGRDIVLLALIDQLLPQDGTTMEEAIESIKHIWAHAQIAGQIHGERGQFAVFNTLLDTIKQVEGDLVVCRPKA